MEPLRTDVLVVGGGTGGTAAALQAARRGANTLIVSEFPWLGGMLTAAGVAAVDGNELAAFQTGIWGAFLQELQQRQPQGLDHGWVSFFTFNPRLGAEIFADWVQQQPNLHWISGFTPKEVLVDHHQVVGVRFANFTVFADIIVDATELGDLLALAAVPFRWGWEFKSQWHEPSAPMKSNYPSKLSPVQAPTWVILLKDYGETVTAPEIPPPPHHHPELFQDAWKHHGVERFLSYGGLPGRLILLNWPCDGNDYGENLQRLIGSETACHELHQEMLWHSQSFAYFIQTQLGRRYGLATGIFPAVHSQSYNFLPTLKPLLLCILIIEKADGYKDSQPLRNGIFYRCKMPKLRLYPVMKPESVKLLRLEIMSTIITIRKENYHCNPNLSVGADGGQAHPLRFPIGR
jgi:hypothetical protein